MVSLPSKFVLGEYWSCESGEHSSGIRVRGVQIRSVLTLTWLTQSLSVFGPQPGAYKVVVSFVVEMTT